MIMTDPADAQTRARRSLLDMPAEEFRALGHALIDDIARFYESLPGRRLTDAGTPENIRALIGQRDLPESGEPADTLLQEVAPLLFDHSLHNGHPKFFGYITSSAAPLGALADLLVAAVNANVAKWDLSPVASEIEGQTVRWIAELIGYEPDCSGLMVSGGNMANFHAFVAARTAKVPWDIRKLGNRGGAQPLTVYVSSETHTWIEKAVDVCGLGSDAIRWIATDSDGRVRLDRLRAQLDEDRRGCCLPFLVVGTAGSVSTGAIDPLRDLASLCREEDVWFHVDGAYGAPAACLPEAPEDLRCLSLADSIAVDPHKWLYCPIEAACVLTRHESALRSAFGFHPDYYHFDASQMSATNYYEIGMQNSRGFKALKVWLALRRAGLRGYRDSIRDDIRLAEALFARVDEHAELEAHSINLSIACFRYVPPDIAAGDPVAAAYLNDLNKALLQELQSGGRVFLSNAVVGDNYLLRACIVNFRTHDDDIEAIPGIIAALGRQLDGAMRPADLARGPSPS
jgi:glutamate/tyrosine decarboxylase-like PLP-dependent enzyme